jgi:hypothetical protein
MTAKLVLRLFAAIAAVPVILWALLSLVITAFSIARQPISLSFRFYAGESTSPGFYFRELPVWLSLGILAGAALLARRVFRGSRAH